MKIQSLFIISLLFFCSYLKKQAKEKERSYPSIKNLAETKAQEKKRKPLELS